MASIKIIDGQTYWQNQLGQLVPASKVGGEEQAKDQLMTELIEKWEVLREELRALKSWIYSEVGAYFELLQEKYGANPRETEAVTLRDYSGRYKLQIQVSSVIDFGEQLMVAKGLIDECIERWSEGSNTKLVTIVKDAFRVNQEGKVSIPRILGLRKLEIDDEQWKRAMEAITDAVIVTHTKKYVRLYRREGEENKLVAIPLDMASI